jgi:hypothetical protein
LKNIVEIARSLRRAYLRRRRPPLLIPLLLIVLLTAAIGVLGYFKLSPIPKIPVPPLVELKAAPLPWTPRALDQTGVDFAHARTNIKKNA